MSETKIYPDGIRTFAKNDKAPDWVLGSLVLNMNDFYSWLKAHPEYHRDYKGTKQIRFEISKTRDNRVSLNVDTYGLDKQTDDTGIPISDLERSAMDEKRTEKPSSKREQKPVPDVDDGLPF